MLLVIDNYDSFTYNLVQYFGELGAELLVKRNDEISLTEIRALNPEKICVSPGPCSPREAGISNEVIRTFGPRIPLFGVCLGHQCIGDVFGGKVVRAGRLMHGKTSPILHDGKGVFSGIPSPFEATRYHSLLVERASTVLKLLPKPKRKKSWACDTRNTPSTGYSSTRSRFSHWKAKGFFKTSFCSEPDLSRSCHPENRIRVGSAGSARSTMRPSPRTEPPASRNGFSFQCWVFR